MVTTVFSDNCRCPWHIVSPQPGEAVVGPLQVVVETAPGFHPEAAWVHWGSNRVSGTLAPPFVYFLLPPPASSSIACVIIMSDGNRRLFKANHFLSIQLLDMATPESPYELREARAKGVVLGREQIYGSGPPIAVAHGETLNWVMRHGASPLLDVGCGIGAYIQALMACGWTANGVELNADYVRQGLESGLAVSGYDGKHLPFKDAAFDTVMAIEVLEHVVDWADLLSEMLRVCRRRVLITTPNIGVLCGMGKFGVVPWHILEATHVNFFTPETWRHVILNWPGVHGFATPFSDLIVNGQRFSMHVFVMMEKGYDSGSEILESTSD